ncbi:MAG: hypothetical protein AAGH76_10225 [Pseudomonadota bacterium]
MSDSAEAIDEYFVELAVEAIQRERPEEILFSDKPCHSAYLNSLKNLRKSETEAVDESLSGEPYFTLLPVLRDYQRKTGRKQKQTALDEFVAKRAQELDNWKIGRLKLPFDFRSYSPTEFRRSIESNFESMEVASLSFEKPTPTKTVLVVSLRSTLAPKSDQTLTLSVFYKDSSTGFIASRIDVTEDDGSARTLRGINYLMPNRMSDVIAHSSISERDFLVSFHASAKLVVADSLLGGVVLDNHKAP